MENSFQIHVLPFSETEPAVRRQIEKNGNSQAVKGGNIWFRIGEAVYSCPDIPETRALAEGLRLSAGGGPRTEADALRAVLTGAAEADSILPYRTGKHAGRCVVLLRPLQGSFSDHLLEDLPLEGEDRAVSMENGDAALILSTARRTQEEICEFAAAAAETLESEIGFSCCAGVGMPCSGPEGIAASYREAKTAADTGLRHQIPGRVYAYDRQALERLADLIPAERAAEYRAEILPKTAEKILTDEILETVRAFFRNDLNLSTTARQLFLHRNTLLYRIEKVRKATGLDLRRFEDAAVFRFMMCFSDTKE